MGRHSAQSSPWACGTASSAAAGPGTRKVDPVALQTGSQPAGSWAWANGAATVVNSTHSQAASKQRAERVRCCRARQSMGGL